jgi:hypothetical protein
MLANAPWQYPEELIGNPPPYWFAPDAATIPISTATATAVTPTVTSLVMFLPIKNNYTKFYT